MFQNQSRRFRRIRNGDAEGVPQFFIGLSERGYAFFRHVVQGDEIARVLIFQRQRRALGGDTTAVQNDDEIRLRRLFHIMRDLDDGDAVVVIFSFCLK